MEIFHSKFGHCFVILEFMATDYVDFSVSGKIAFPKWCFFEATDHKYHLCNLRTWFSYVPSNATNKKHIKINEKILREAWCLWGTISAMKPSNQLPCVNMQPSQLAGSQEIVCVLNLCCVLARLPVCCLVLARGEMVHMPVAPFTNMD